MSWWKCAGPGHGDRSDPSVGRGESSGLVEDEAGLSTVEYIIILVLIAVLGIVAWKQFGQAVEYKVRQSTTQVNTL
ncbi:MAG: hypothetical protein GXP55_01095 [Deltaproteobacteria bacterium]|nr:hypothetical protein [Deltaproteobacteria bacterium]